jgi:hypothetical protein
MTMPSHTEIRHAADRAEEGRCRLRGRLDRKAVLAGGDPIFGPPPYMDLHHPILRDVCIDAYWQGRKEPRP